MQRRFLFFMVSAPLLYSVAKLACFSYGCCHGIEYDGPFHYVYKHSVGAPNNVPLFPIQLVETITSFILFIYILFRTKKINSKSIIIGESMVLFGILKFSLDFLRESHVGQIISLNQVLSIILSLWGLIIIIKDKKKRID